MEGVPEPRLFPFLRCQGLYRLQVEVVIQVKVVEVLAMDQEVQHVVALAADLHTRLHPVQLGSLEEFCGLEGLKKTPLFLGLRSFMMEAVENPTLQELLVTDAHLHWVALWAVLLEPLRDQGYIVAAPGLTRAPVKRLRCPIETNGVGRVLILYWLLFKDRIHLLWHLELFRWRIRAC